MNDFIKEVCTQSTILPEVFNLYKTSEKHRIKEIADYFNENSFEKIIFVGMGSSLYATYSVISYLSSKGIPSLALNAYDLKEYNMAQINSKTLVVCISQSGNSWEVVELAKELKDKIKVVGIYNNEKGELSRLCDFKLPLFAGVETSITNKTYQCTLLVLNMLVHEICNDNDEMFQSEIEIVIDWCSDWLSNYREKTMPLLKFSDNIEMFDFMGYGESMSTARQARLIFREGLKAYTCASEFADYAHGLYLSAQKNYMGIMFLPVLKRTQTEDRMINHILRSNGKIILFTTGVFDEKNNLQTVILPKVRPSLVPLMEIIPCDTLMGMLLGEGWIR
ncbi:SIS domain-containing protein [Tepidimicrobium xylanilyticum]|uniref:SIS domain-containing protein n=1 Tax=Tepidimicrobium xylanilyticum TaxID=1123352 RepID=UPI00264D6776|nr:SIS domain-containing protein [Tepidimicrobium xylanilyticum]GMG97771.1 glucosamine--fructose-6-phosphate aminotransferase [Tepidimicrobium xylanilyticum]